MNFNLQVSIGGCFTELFSIHGIVDWMFLSIEFRVTFHGGIFICQQLDCSIRVFVHLALTELLILITVHMCMVYPSYKIFVRFF